MNEKLSMDPRQVTWRQVYTLRDAAAALFRQSRVSIACFIFVFAAVLAVVFMAPTMYESELKILVKRDRSDTMISGAAGTDRTAGGDVSEPELLSEAELLQGHDLLEQVAAAARLPQRTSEAESAGNPSQALAVAVKTLRKDLSVAPIRRTWMIEVTYASPDPQQAKDVLDQLARLYLEKHLALRRPPGAYQFFSEQLAQAAEELRVAQAQLGDFGKSNQVVSAAAQKQTALQQLAEFEGLQRQTEATLAETSRRVTALGLERARTPERRTSVVRTSDAAGLMQEMQSRILNLELQRTQLLQKFTPQYRLVTEIDQQLDQARAAFDQARRAPVREETTDSNPTLQWLENETARARTERSALDTRAKTLGATVREYRNRAQSLDTEDARQKALLRDVASAEEKYLLYQRKQEEARISDALDRTRIANVAIAEPPTVPAEPRPRHRALWLSLGLMGALALSLGVALATDALSPSVRTPSELQTTLNVPVLAWVPANR